MKRKFRVFLGSIFLSVSIGCLFYPDYYKWKMDCEINIIEKEILEPLPQKENKEKEKNYEALYKEMEIYNQRLEIQGQNLVDAWSYEEPPIPLRFIPNEDYAVGTIEIPDMQVKLPLFLGASKRIFLKVQEFYRKPVCLLGEEILTVLLLLIVDGEEIHIFSILKICQRARWYILKIHGKQGYIRQ